MESPRLARLDAHVVCLDVWKRFDDHVVLRDACLTIRRGEVAVVIGKSGCGKTSTEKSWTTPAKAMCIGRRRCPYG
jgi:ABC-type transporter Mla maintaining outer membrane lipid asymmetry ATPase subunit MlaF